MDKHLIGLYHAQAALQHDVKRSKHIAVKQTRNCPFHNNKPKWNKVKKLYRRLKHVEKQITQIVKE